MYTKTLIKFSFLRLGITIIILFIILNGAELFLRIQPDSKIRYDFSQYEVLQSSWLCRHLNEQMSLFRPSPTLIYEHIPNSSPNINSYGMIGREYRLKKPKGVYRILILGDSLAAYSNNVRILEQKLNGDSLLASKYTFEIWNSGVGSYDIRQYANYLRYKGIKYNPDMVIVFFCLNDFDLNDYILYKNKDGFTAYHLSARELSKTYIPNVFLLRHSYLYRLLVLRLEGYLLEKRKNQIINQQEGDGRYYLRTIKQICESKKIALTAAIFPYLKPFSEYTDLRKQAYEAMVKILEGLGVEYIDLHSFFPEEKRYSLRQNSSDYIHFNLEGDEIAADVIYGHLKKYIVRPSLY